MRGTEKNDKNEKIEHISLSLEEDERGEDAQVEVNFLTQQQPQDDWELLEKYNKITLKTLSEMLGFE